MFQQVIFPLLSIVVPAAPVVFGGQSTALEISYLPAARLCGSLDPSLNVLSLETEDTRLEKRSDAATPNRCKAR